MCTGEQQGRGEAAIEGEAQADGTSNELKLVANNGCPKNRWNGAVVLPKCLFFRNMGCLKRPLFLL